VVSELLDYLEQSMDCKIQIRQTALQPFSEENYQQGSYARLWRSEAPAAVDAEPVEANPKQTEPLETMELSQLQRFFRNPVRYFYQQSLVAHLVELQSAVHDEENFELDQLQQYQLRQMAVEQVLQQGEVDIETLQNSGLLLPGVAGELQVQPLIEAGLAVATALVNDPAYGARQRLDISLPVGQSSIAGNLTSYASDVLLDYNLSRNRGKSRLLLWIGHCALCAQDRIEESRLYHLDGIDRFQILTRDDALGILEDLVAVYQEGLRQPLPMAPNISMNYLPQPTKKGRGGASDSASRLAAIQRSWNGYSPPFEASDAYIKLAFARGLPFDEAFGPLAERVFKPLLEALIDE
jgi:exodeoxyribonuclease V gamma subunit